MYITRTFIITLLSLFFITSVYAQTTKITEELMEFKTYPFSDPDPVPEINRIYPYFYFHGYTNNAVQQKWKMVVLENEYIKVFVCPAVGGKVWGAIEKSTGKEFLYFNHVVKFRDVGMRGAWTSGGLEYNFGDIGHIPTCSTPVDYITKENADGSVSCVVGAIDLPSGTKWNVEIKVSPGKAFFETKASWFNNTELPCTYYHWMNAAAKAADDLEFIYPGKNWIGHGAEKGNWPVHNGRDVNWYKNNNFGSYKSYHILNSYSNYFGGYYHDENFGFGHSGDFDDKPGKKLWIWGLAQQGMIWEDLLTDTDGQYIEFQAGKLFNQAANSSTLTPFKHKEFAPHDADIMNEMWFPLKGTEGMNAVSEYGVLNVIPENNSLTILLSALQKLDDELMVYLNGEMAFSKSIKLNPLELFKTSIKANNSDEIEIEVGNGKLRYSSDKNDELVDRPLLPNDDFNWESAYGLFTKGLELEKQREYIRAKEAYENALAKEAGFLPALNRMALSYYRQMDYKSALDYIRKSLAIDSYNGEANYFMGLISRETGDLTLSKSGFSIAMGDVAYRSSAATELANLFLLESDWRKAERYAKKALVFNNYNLDALQILAIANRKLEKPDEAKQVLTNISEIDGTNHFLQFELYLLSNHEDQKDHFIENISNELIHESFLDLAISYAKKGCKEEANQVLKLAPQNPIVELWLAKLNPEEKESHIQLALDQSPEFVFPHRIETAKILKSIIAEKSDWKLHYYLGLVLWNKGLLDEAKQEFIACGNNPTFAPFYLAKSKLVSSKSEQLECLQTAYELDPKNWRSALELSRFYNSENKEVEALDIIEPFLKKYPEQSSLGLCYVQSLSKLEKYEKAISFLDKYQVLPFEGATIGRDLYNEACVRSAFLYLSKEKHKKAIQFAEKAKSWPVNLGVGRPYDVDERLEDYILSLAYKGKGDKKKSEIFAGKVMDYEHPGYRKENSKLYLQLLLLTEYQQADKAFELLSEFKLKYPESNSIKWVEAKINESPDTKNIERSFMQDPATSMAYDPKFKDKSFKLLFDFLKSIEK